MKQLLFSVVLVAVLLNTATLALSIVRPDRRVWPPPRTDSWQQRYNATVTYTGLIGFLVLGILDWNSLTLPSLVRYVGGGALFACGFFALWGYSTLGVDASQGLGDELVTTGPYRYSRNPQYVGTIPALLGYAVLCSSSVALMLAVPICGWFVLVPFAEESWCRENLGTDYERYLAEVPRFLGRRSLRRRNQA